MQLKNKLISLYERMYKKHWEKKANKTYKRLKNIIVLESIPDCSDNTKAVFDELICQGINKKYKIIWILDKTSSSSHPQYKNVYYLPSWAVELEYYKKVAKALVCCNDFLKKYNEKQFSMYLSHGTAIKSVRHYYTVPEGIDCFLVTSQNVAEMQCYELNFDIDKTVALGFPRNDVFVCPEKDIKKLLNTTCEKVVVWYPTFRQIKLSRKTGISITNCENALPVIHDESIARSLNDFAKEKNVLIVIKPHFAQDLDCIKKLDLSNIVFIDDAFFLNNGINSYEFLNSCDAMITDYSSVYYDYTLCNKPIAVVWEDIAEYKENPGLVNDYESMLKGAEKIYSFEDFIGFIERVSKNIDLLKKEREEIRDFVNISVDGKNSERVVDYIMKNIQ